MNRSRSRPVDFVLISCSRESVSGDQKMKISASKKRHLRRLMRDRKIDEIRAEQFVFNEHTVSNVAMSLFVRG